MTFKKIEKLAEDLTTIFTVEGELCKEVSIDGEKYLFPIDIGLQDHAYKVFRLKNDEFAEKIKERGMLKDLCLKMHENGYFKTIGMKSIKPSLIETAYSCKRK